MKSDRIKALDASAKALLDVYRSLKVKVVKVRRSGNRVTTIFRVTTPGK